MGMMETVSGTFIESDAQETAESARIKEKMRECIPYSSVTDSAVKS